MNWTRQHDAWIAEHCEGLEVSQTTNGLGEVDYATQLSMPPSFGHFGNTDYVVVVTPIATYLTDPAACIRAAEAWRKKGEQRGWEVGRGSTFVANTFQWDDERGRYVKDFKEHCESDESPAAALAQALYRATGGPA